ncbi:hypothetical protein F4810DRAFT_668156 [Camillea tinctor]|nr:hypothetical protein F4810DRAFT_668156 [Camillea tinctor]
MNYHILKVDVLDLDKRVDNGKVTDQAKFLSESLKIFLPVLKCPSFQEGFENFLNNVRKRGILPTIPKCGDNKRIIDHYMKNHIFVDSNTGRFRVAIKRWPKCYRSDILAAELLEEDASSSLAVYNVVLLSKLMDVVDSGYDRKAVSIDRTKSGSSDLILTIGLSMIPALCRNLVRRLKAGRIRIDSTGQCTEHDGNGNVIKDGIEMGNDTDTFNETDENLINGFASCVVREMFGGNLSLRIIPSNPDMKRWNYVVYKEGRVGLIPKRSIHDLIDHRESISLDLPWEDDKRKLITGTTISVFFEYHRITVITKPLFKTAPKEDDDIIFIRSQSVRKDCEATSNLPSTVPGPNTTALPIKMETDSAPSDVTPKTGRPPPQQPSLSRALEASSRKRQRTHESARPTPPSEPTNVAPTTSIPPTTLKLPGVEGVMKKSLNTTISLREFNEIQWLETPHNPEGTSTTSVQPIHPSIDAVMGAVQPYTPELDENPPNVTQPSEPPGTQSTAVKKPRGEALGQTMGPLPQCNRRSPRIIRDKTLVERLKWNTL